MNSLTNLHLKLDKKPQLIAAWDTYNTWMDKELRLIEAGDMNQAKTVDEEYVDPAFENLERILVNIELDLLNQGKQVRKKSILGAIGLILGSGLLIGLLIVKNRRATVAVEVLRAEQRTLKRSEENLQSEKNKLSSVIGAMSSYLTIIDRDYTVMYQSPLSEKLFGNFIGKKCYQVFGHDEKMCDGCPVELAFHDAQFHRSIREIVMPDGKITYVENVANPIKDYYGEIVSCLEITTDITDRKHAEEKIKASLLEKETMLKEIHHRVKNNLQVISSLLDMQSSSLQDEKAKEALWESMARVRTMAMIHTRLYQSPDLTMVDFGLFIRDLIGNISQSYGRAAVPVEINVDAGEIRLGIDISIPCGLILNELVANALKHAFPEGKEGEINIRMQSEDSRVVLTVQDNGIGFPESIDLTNLKSMGLKLVNILVRQMNGKIDMQVDSGTTWTITFSIKSERVW